MRTIIIACALLLAANAGAQTLAPATTITARVGTDTAAYNYVEALQQYANGLLAGAGWASNDTPDQNRETWAGVGRLFNIGGVRVLAVGYVDQALGEATDAQTSILPWLLATRNFGKVTGTANYFVYTPVGDGEAIHVLEHSKAEYRVATRWLAGAGYAGQKVGDGPWVHKPFVTTTYQSKLGAFEVWAQRPEEGRSTFQLRYTQVF